MSRLAEVARRYPEVPAREEEWVADLQRWVRQRTISNTEGGNDHGERDERSAGAGASAPAWTRSEA